MCCSRPPHWKNQLTGPLPRRRQRGSPDFMFKLDLLSRDGNRWCIFITPACRPWGDAPLRLELDSEGPGGAFAS